VKYLISKKDDIYIIFILFILVSASFIISSALSTDNAKSSEMQAELSMESSPKIDLEFVSIFEGGRLYKAGKFNVVVLNGTYREMGRQYGGLLGPEIKKMHEETLNTIPIIAAKLGEGGGKVSGVSPQNLAIQDFATLSLQTYPKRFLEMIIGISETSGVPVVEVATVNEFMRYFLWWWLENPDAKSHPAARTQGFCSAITAWGNYTGGKPLVMGRNYDLPPVFKNFNKYLTIVVFNPIDGSNSVAILAYAGQVGAAQAFNDAGLVLESNDGSSSGDLNRPMDRVPLQVRDVQLALDYSDLEGLDAGMKSSLIFHPMLYNVANQSEAYCYETATFDIKRRGGIDGLLVGTNHFIIPEWTREGILTKSSTDSISRYENLTVLGNKYRGYINASVMMAIMNTPRERGGATWLDDTLFQFVAVPEQKKIWLNAPGFEDWKEIDLEDLYQ
jgi:hypothetical protein